MKFKNKKSKKKYLGISYDDFKVPCEICGIYHKNLRISFSRSFDCWICKICYKIRLEENQGDRIDPDWWK